MQILVLSPDLPNQNMHPVFDKPSGDPGAQRRLRACGPEETGTDRQGIWEGQSDLYQSFSTRDTEIQKDSSSLEGALGI